MHALAELTLQNGRPLWAREQLESHLDDIQLALYDEPAENPYWDEDSGTSLSWRQVGVTAYMVLELCRRHGIPVYVLWRNSLVESYVPHAPHKHLTHHVLHIHGDHAYFLADPRTKQHVAQMMISQPQEMQQISENRSHRDARFGYGSMPEPS